MKTFKVKVNFIQLFKSDDEFYDTRCICICPSLHTVDATIPETNRKIYIEIMGKENW